MEQDCFVDGDWWTEDLALTSDPQSATASSPERDTSLPIAAHVLEGSRLVGVRLIPRTYRSSFLRPNTFKKQTPVAACDSPASKHLRQDKKHRSLCYPPTPTRPVDSNMLPQT